MSHLACIQTWPYLKQDLNVSMSVDPMFSWNQWQLFKTWQYLKYCIGIIHMQYYVCFLTADPVDTKEPSSTGSCQVSPWWNDRRYEKPEFLHSEIFLAALICPRIKLRTGYCFQCIGTSFRRVIPDSGPASNNPEKVRKLLLCTGKVFYELAKVRVL